MKTTHIKNIVIWTLVAVNLVFLGYWLFGNAVNYRKNAETNKEIQTLFEKSGISMDINCIHSGGALYTLESSRSVENKKGIAQVLLGPTQMTVQGGIIYTFTSNDGKGQAVFNNSGEFTVNLTQGVIPSSSRDDDTVQQLLEKMKIDAVIEMPTKGNNKDEGSKTIKAVCTWKKRQIFGCIIEFVFEADSLRQIKGKYAPDITVSSGKAEMSSCATALMAFLGEVKSGRYACKEILSVDAGYYMTVSTGRIEPTWRIRTDSDDYYMNALSNKVEVAT